MKSPLSQIASLLAIGISLALSGQTRAAISVTTNNNATTLANDILGGGVSLISASISGSSLASGTFTGGLSAGIGIDTGILLTSGFASNVTGSNLSSGITGDNSGAGYAPLNTLSGGTTHDANVLTINFNLTNPGSLFFNYVFGSDEYNEYVGSQYNDVFGFFLDGTAPANNLALIPSTTTPVSINTVNSGSNSAYYNNNSPTVFAFEYDGFTKVLTATASGLSAGNHTITLAIADTSDYVFDSGVFIQGGTLSDTPTSTAPEGGATLIMLSLSMAGLGALRKRLGA